MVVLRSCNTFHDTGEHGEISVQGGADYYCSKFHGSRGTHVTAEHHDHGYRRVTPVRCGMFNDPQGSTWRSAAVQ